MTAFTVIGINIIATISWQPPSISQLSYIPFFEGYTHFTAWLILYLFEMSLQASIKLRT